jgi:alpha-mannosidase
VEAVVREGYALNCPVTALQIENARGSSASNSLCEVSNPNVVIEAGKRAEGDDGMVIRLYEAGRTRGPVAVTFRGTLTGAMECNLMEESLGEAEYEGNTLLFDISPFEIKTFKVLVKVDEHS